MFFWNLKFCLEKFMYKNNQIEWYMNKSLMNLNSYNEMILHNIYISVFLIVVTGIVVNHGVGVACREFVVHMDMCPPDAVHPQAMPLWCCRGK